jgi:ABC-type sugar transport system ATPase subunit
VSQVDIHAPPRLQVSGLTKRYGRVQALQDVSFDLERGEILGLVGENGAGKSTFIKMLSGLVQPDRGEIRIEGQVCRLHNSADAQASGVAVVQQEYSSVPNLTVAENIFLGQRSAPLIWRRKSLARSVVPLLEQVGLDHIDPGVEVSRLSVAERQLLEIARVLARDARIVLFDEPTASLSDTEIGRVLAVVTGLAKGGHSVIYVTHRLRELEGLVDRILVFRDGRSLPPRRQSELSVDDLVGLMLGRRVGDLFPERPGTPGRTRLSVQALSTPGLVKPVSFDVRAGEIFGLTGQMGSGANLVVQALAGQKPVQAGMVRVDGAPLDLRSRRAGIAAGIGYCSSDRQFDGLFPGISVERNLSSPWLVEFSAAGQLSRRRERALAGAAAASMAIDEGRLHSDAATLSGGNQQKVALGRWAHKGTQVLLVEEPTRGVDIGARADIYRRIRTLCADGMAVIVASSDTSEIAGLCDQIAAFYRGEMVDLRPAAAWTDTSLLAAVLGGTDHQQNRPLD